jgi:hypothetical protein
MTNLSGMCAAPSLSKAPVNTSGVQVAYPDTGRSNVLAAF